MANVEHTSDARVLVPEGSTEDMAAMRRSFRGNRGASLVIEGVAQATA